MLALVHHARFGMRRSLSSLILPPILFTTASASYAGSSSFTPLCLKYLFHSRDLHPRALRSFKKQNAGGAIIKGGSRNGATCSGTGRRMTTISSEASAAAEATRTSLTARRKYKGARFAVGRNLVCKEDLDCGHRSPRVIRTYAQCVVSGAGALAKDRRCPRSHGTKHIFTK